MTSPPWPPVLIDEDFPAPIARTLRKRSLSSVEIVAEGALRGAEDQALVDRAAALGGVLVSHNQRDRARFRDHVQVWRQRGDDTLCVLFLPRDTDDERLLLRTLLLLTWYVAHPRPKLETMIWNDIAQALIHGYQPADFSLTDLRYALGQSSPGTGSGP